MSSIAAENLYHLWAVDHAAYGPVELPTLVASVKDDRVLADSWIFVARDNAWHRAADLPELQMFFSPSPPRAPTTHPRAQPPSAPACCAA